MTTHGQLSPPMTLFNNWPGSPRSEPEYSSSSSIGGLSSTSSLASTFSDTGAKTHAFFASPFTHSDMLSSETNTTSTPTQPRSITADFFSTPVRTPSPPPPRSSTIKTSNLLANIHPSRIFPSRYTSRNDDDDDDDDREHHHRPKKPRPEFLLLDLDRDDHQHDHNQLVLSPRDLSSLSSTSTFSSSSSTRSSLALPEHTNPHRLPTPPPPPSPFFASHAALYVPSDSTNEPTPRPPHLETRYTKAGHYARDNEDGSGDGDDDDDVQVYLEPVPGCIITSNPPCIAHPKPISPTLTVTPPPDSTTFSTTETSSFTTTTASLGNSNSSSSSHLISGEPTTTTTLHLLRPLGQGAFSSVWLAEDKSHIPLTTRSKKSIRELRKKASTIGGGGGGLSRSSSIRGGGGGGFHPRSRIGSNSSSVVSLSRQSSLDGGWGGGGGDSKPPPPPSLSVLGGAALVGALEREGSLRMRKLRAKLPGTRPMGFDTNFLDERHGKMGMGVVGEGSGSGTLDPPPTTSVSRRTSSKKKGKLVAVKMTPRRATAAVSTSKSTKREEEERTRVGFVREVEVLKHISHPNITVLLEHLSTSSHHILVLPYLPGGDLLGLVNNDVAWSKLGENVLRRIWSELCKAVGWMHGIGLVHRDIKLENILLTTSSFSSLTSDSPRPTLETLPTPLIKLTDFGLSRFIHIDETTGESELLSTRCGSEAYAAPELVMGSGGGGGTASKGFYDARETDAWACGVVLYALVARRLPFGEGVSAVPNDEHHHHHQQEGGRIGGDGAPGYGHGHGRGSIAERRHWLMRIARGEYEWPAPPSPPLISSDVNVNVNDVNSNSANSGDSGELIGASLLTSEGVKRIVGKLLIRDPKRRAKVMDLWDDKWMWGCGGGLAVGMTQEEWKEREREREQEKKAATATTATKQVMMMGLGIDFIQFGDDSPEAQDVQIGQGADVEGITIDVDEHQFLDEGLCEGESEGGGGEEDEEDDDDGEEGCLLDEEGIANVARQELV